MNCKKRPQNDVVNEKYPPPFQLAVVLVKLCWIFKLQEK